MRTAIFWLHLSAGVLAGLVVLLLSATGVLLAFERQIVAFAERDLRAATAGTPLPLSRIVAAAGGQPTNVLVRSDRSAPVAVALGRERTLFVNPYTAEVLGEGARGLRAFFQLNEDLHRWLALKGPGRERGKAITGAANLVFLFIVLSGLFLWIPRRWTRRSLRNSTLFRSGLRGRLRDYSWHNVIGIWCFLPLAAIIVSGAVISYPWATRLVYRVFGGEAPRPPADGRSARSPLDPAALDALDRVARTSLPADWQTFSIRLPLAQKGPVTVAVDRGNGARPDKRSQLMIDLRSGRVVEHKTYAQQEPGQKARAWLRWIHTGEAGGLIGQLVAMFASAGAVVLVWTGISLALRRFARVLRGAPAQPTNLEEEYYT
jgi:uncharacterized iron-regulated membrane protein